MTKLNDLIAKLPDEAQRELLNRRSAMHREYIIAQAATVSTVFWAPMDSNVLDRIDADLVSLIQRASRGAEVSESVAKTIDNALDPA